jgi:hypothetical protein
MTKTPVTWMQMLEPIQHDHLTHRTQVDQSGPMSLKAHGLGAVWI